MSEEPIIGLVVAVGLGLYLLDTAYPSGKILVQTGDAMTLSAGPRSPLYSRWSGLRRPLSRLIAGVYAGERKILTPVIGPVELAAALPLRRGRSGAARTGSPIRSRWSSVRRWFLALYVFQRLQNFCR